MSSLVRRSLRTTVAAAGIAVAGVGLAGPAFAAPALPEIPQAPGTTETPGTTAVPDAGGVEAGQLMDEAPATPEAPAEEFVVPGVVNFEMPTITTAAPELPAGDAFALPGAPGTDATETPDTEGIAEFEAEPVEGPSPESFFEGQNSVGAMQALDMASLAMEMAQSAAAGDSFTENQQIG